MWCQRCGNPKVPNASWCVSCETVSTIHGITGVLSSFMQGASQPSYGYPSSPSLSSSVDMSVISAHPSLSHDYYSTPSFSPPAHFLSSPSYAYSNPSVSYPSPYVSYPNPFPPPSFSPSPSHMNHPPPPPPS